MDNFVSYISDFNELLERQFLDIPRWKVVLGSLFSSYAVIWTKKTFDQIDTDIVSYIKKKTFRVLIKLPFVQKKIQAELEEVDKAIEDELITEKEKDLAKYHEIPLKGVSKEEIKKLATETLSLGAYEWKEGKVSGGMFAGSDDSYSNFMIELARMTSWTNPLHPDIFPGVVKMEAEIVRMTASIFHGDENVMGSVTTGGTESLVLMMKTYRDWGLHTRGIRHPEIIVPHTIHPAVDKGVEHLGYSRIWKIPVDPKTMSFKISDIAKKINSNTVLIAISAPDCAYGCIDDAEAVGALAKSRGIPLHVDSCLGGFILPFMDRAGFPLPQFDFRVPGVTSISADTHKYGKTPKGTSVILYRSKEFSHHQYSTVTDWPGGIYATPTIPGSRSGSNIAMCWGAMLIHGFDGYVETTRKIITIARWLAKELNKIPGLFVYGNPKGPIVSMGSKEFNIYLLADALSSRGWHLQPLQNPLGIHVYLTPLHTKEGVAENLLKEIKDAVQAVKTGSNQVTKGMARLYGLANALPDKSIIGEVSKIYFDVYYSTPE